MVETKFCTTCGEIRIIGKFRVHKRVSSSGITREYISKKCTPCVVQYNKGRSTPERLAKYAETSKEKRRLNKLWAVGYKGGECEHCGKEFHVAAFDFHHLNPKDKITDIGLMFNGSRETLTQELDKCILLCANCHRIHHYEEGNLGEIKKGKGKT